MIYLTIQATIGAMAAFAAWLLAPFAVVAALATLSMIAGAVAIWRA